MASYAPTPPSGPDGPDGPDSSESPEHPEHLEHQAGPAGTDAGGGPGEVRDPRSGRYPRPVVTADEAAWVWRDLADRSHRDPARPEEVRLAVVAGLARATGARYGDLLRVTVDDLTLDARRDGADGGQVGGEVGGEVTVRHGKHRAVRRHPFDAPTAAVVRRWRDVRRELCAELEGSVPRALLLTVHHTHDHGVTVSRGLPITAQGLVLSWRRYVLRTAAEQGARRRPLPTRFEQVRRAWVAQRDDNERGRPVRSTGAVQPVRSGRVTAPGRQPTLRGARHERQLAASVVVRGPDRRE